MESSSPWWSFLTVSNANSVLSSSHRNQNISIIISNDFFLFFHDRCQSNYPTHIQSSQYADWGSE